MARNVLARSMIEAGRQRRRLPEVAAQLYDEDAGVHRGNLFQ